MRANNERLAQVSTEEAIAFGSVLREQTATQVRLAYRNAAGRPAVSLDKYKKTTLAAVFVMDYTAIVVKRERFSLQKKRLLASLVLGEGGLKTLCEIHKIGGSVPHIVNHLQPFSGFSEEKAKEIVERATRRRR